MAIKVGNSWVTEASYARAKASTMVENTGKPEKDILQSLKEKFPGTSFSTSTAPFGGSGTNNIAIAPNILNQMSSDPEKRLEYEALIMDCVDLQKSMPTHSATGSRIKSQGFIINGDGSLSGWCVTEGSGSNTDKKSVTELYKDQKESWLEKLLAGVDDTDTKVNNKGSLNMKI